MTTFFNLGNNESLSNYSWNDIVRPATEGRERAPLEKENFRPEDTEETEIFIRELVQNSLDAKDRDDSRFNNQPVFISIKYVDIDDNFKSVYTQLFPKTLKEWLTQSGDIDEKYKRTFKALVISDYGTHGLKDEDWKKYFYGSGKGNKSSKTNKSLGSANQGKVAIWALSNIWTIFCKSHTTEEKIKGQGLCLMSEVVELDDGKNRRTCDAYFEKEGDPFLDDKEIKILEKTFELKEREKNDYGTDFILLEAIPNDYAFIIQAILKNWAIPISENQISFDVGGTQINQENIIKLLDENKKYLGDITSEYINFCIESRKKTDQLNSYSLKTDLTIEKLRSRVLNEEMFENNTSAEELIEVLNDGKIVEIKYAPPIEYKEKTSSQKHAYSVFIKLQSDDSEAENQSNSFGLLLRDYQVLWDERKRVSKAAQSRNDIFLLICTYDDNFEELMKLFEEPSHLKFNQKKINFSSPDVPYKENNAKQNLSIFRQSANKAINYIFSADTQDDPHFFSNLFPYVFIKEKTRKKKKKKNDKDPTPNPPVIPVLKSTPPALDVNQNKDTIRIKSTKDYEWEAGDSFTITLAANSLEGNKDPFKEYSIFDFDLADSKRFRIPLEDGCDVITSAKNIITFEPYQNDFEIQIQGFHPHWGYISKYRFKKGEQGGGKS